MTKDALKLALEALEDFDYDKRIAAITAIKAALAQEQKLVKNVVAYHSDGTRTVRISPKREWIGLTEEQFLEAARLAEAGNYLVAFQRIQQWLREENT